MKQFIIYSSEIVYYRTIVMAENVEDAQQKFWDMDHPNLEPYDGDNWKVDEVEHEDGTIEEVL